ncbi:MAG: hypothetical protein C6H99_07620 [Epsilonproteobacteria bacterium]|nr:hypothetical protein [Campylobacterota bacterium]NPA64352.1 hypothetical protein [Campylobacterota bacterium]
MVFFDSDKQSLQVFVDPKGDRWRVQYDQEELARFFKEHPRTSLLAPFVFLAEVAKRGSKNRNLYLLVLPNHIYMAIFQKDVPIFWKIVPQKIEELPSIIALALREFYELPYADFVDSIQIYADKPIAHEKIQKELLIPVEFHSLQESLKSLPIQSIQIQPPKERTYLRNLLLAAAAIILVVVLIKLFLSQKNALLEEQIQGYLKEQVAIGNQNNENKALLMRLQKYRPTIERLEEQNSILQNKIKEVFDLIPPRSYLQKAIFDRDSLILEGVTLDRKEIEEFVDKSLAQKYDLHRVAFERGDEGLRFRLIYKERR